MRTQCGDTSLSFSGYKSEIAAKFVANEKRWRQRRMDRNQYSFDDNQRWPEVLVSIY